MVKDKSQCNSGNRKEIEIMNNSIVNERKGGVSPFVPEYQEYISSYPGRGTLRVQISAAYEAFPVKGVDVEVAVIHNGVRYLLYSDTTNSSGIVDNMVLPTRQVDTLLNPKTSDKDEAQYLVSLFHPSFKSVIDKAVTVYDRIETILPLSLVPANQITEGN
jgi:hypothetical protein